MRVVFMGTPAFAASVLRDVASSRHEVVGVVTRPDAVRGRGRRLVPSAVKEAALDLGIPVVERASLRSDEAFDELAAFAADVVCVAAYGAILPERVLDLPRFGCLNVHASLLPRWRGAAPIERAILAGDALTGIGVMRMEAGLDTGDTTATRTIEVGEMTALELTRELARLGGAALVEVLDALDEGRTVLWTPQPEEGVTYAEKLKKGELDVSPVLAASEASRRVRASGDSHASRCAVAGRRVTLLAARPSELDVAVPPGSVRFASKRLLLGCADGVLEVTEVKPDGKKPMPAAAFAAGVQGIKNDTIEWQGIDGAA